MNDSGNFWAIVEAVIVGALLLFTVTGNIVLRVWLQVLEGFTN